MGLVDDFPIDPFTPSLRYAASSQLPVTVPWTNEIIRLGTSLAVSRTDKSIFRDKTAFSQYSLKQSSLSFTTSSRGSINEASTSAAGRSSEHVHMSISGQIGGKYLGASGQAQYETSVMKDNNSIKASLRTEYHSGKVTFTYVPRLSAEAIDILKTSTDPHQAFRDAYGEYYVGAYILGGANANMISGAAASSSRSKDISAQYTVRALLWTKDGTYEDHEREAASLGIVTVSAFDSLDAWQDNRSGWDAATYREITRSSESNRARGWALAGRVTDKARGMRIESGSEVSWEMCEAICKAGLVAELLLLPYASLWDYTSAVLSAGS